jgi:hypothetical protein
VLKTIFTDLFVLLVFVGCALGAATFFSFIPTLSDKYNKGLAIVMGLACVAVAISHVWALCVGQLR